MKVWTEFLQVSSTNFLLNKLYGFFDKILCKKSNCASMSMYMIKICKFYYNKQKALKANSTQLNNVKLS